MRRSLSNFIPLLALEIIWPFGGVFFATQRRLKEYSTIIYIFLAAFFGYVYTPAPESDMVRYVEDFLRFSEFDWSTLVDKITRGEFSDYYVVLTSYFVSGFSKNPHLFLAFVTSVFAFFYLKCIELILKNFLVTRSLYSRLLIFILYFYVPIFFINGLRFYTAFYVFCYCVVQISFLHKEKFYFLLLLTPLIHISFVASVLIYLVFAVFGQRRIIAYSMIVISIFFSASAFDFSMLSGESKAQEKIINYTDAGKSQDFFENLDDIHAQSSQGYKIFEIFSKYHFYLVLSFLVIILLSKRKILHCFDNYSKELVNLNLFFLSLALFMQNIPEGYRFQHIFCFMFFVTLVPVFGNLERGKFFLFSFLTTAIGIFLYLASNIYLNLRLIPAEFYFSNWLVS